jgi:hypothetical protein
MRTIIVCPKCGQPMREIFAWSIYVDNAYYLHDREYFHFWICEHKSRV